MDDQQRGGNAPAGPGAGRPRHAPALALCLALAVLTFAAFSGALDGDFLMFDDRQYVVENPVVRAGLTREGVSLALTRSYAANWHPLTWISLMLDAQLHGLDPRGFHLTSLLLHAANAVLLFLLIRSLTGSLWRSALAAALFAVHPLRVESVAWIAERKDVLAGFFGLLALLAYVRQARRPGPGPYALTTVLFALGLASKPTVVTWPLLMLVLDAWPLGRFRRLAPADGAPGRSRRRVALWPLVEKIPWLLMSAGVSAVTLVAQSQGGLVVPAEQHLGPRLLNVLWAYGAYLGKTVWPSNLAAYYPYVELSPFSLPVLGSVALLVVITLAAATGLRRRPYIAAGWCWYLVCLVPMAGLVRLGSLSMADRYSYLPLIGPVIAASWLLAGWAQGSRGRRAAAGAVSIATILLLAGLTRAQCAHWLDDEALFTRMSLAVPGNPGGSFGLGRVHRERGDAGGAERFFLQSIGENPRYYPSHIGLARLYVSTGRTTDAEAAFRRALGVDPTDVIARSAFGVVLQQNGKLEEAAENLGVVVRLQPGVAEAHNNLGVVLGQLGRRDDAAAHLRRALEIDPGFVEARRNLELLPGGAGEPP